MLKCKSLNQTFEDLPEPPFCIDVTMADPYLFDRDVEVDPYLAYVVTRKTINRKENRVEFSILDYTFKVYYDENKIVIFDKYLTPN